MCQINLQVVYLGELCKSLVQNVGCIIEEEIDKSKKEVYVCSDVLLAMGR